MNDISVGGQGAPLAPIFHQVMLKNKKGLIINLGGIANVSYLIDNTMHAFDIGPANTLLDNWFYLHKHNKSDYYDKNGNWAKKGVVDNSLLENLLTDKYFNIAPPKSTGVEYFNLKWLKKYLNSKDYKIKPENVQRTLIELTAIIISNAIKEINPNKYPVFFCGGGCHNKFLINRIKFIAKSYKITNTKKLNYNPDYVEAAAFAYLAKKRLLKEKLFLKYITGAKKRIMLGNIYYPNKL